MGHDYLLDAMIYTRGSPDDWNRYAALTGDPGWAWNAIQSYIAKVAVLVSSASTLLTSDLILQNEKWTPPADGHNTSGQYDPTIHSSTGINAVSLAGYPHPINSRVIATTEELPDEFPLVLDMNPGKAQGVGKNSRVIP